MTIRARLFAVLRDRAGTDELSLDLPEGSTVAEARDRIGARLPRVAGLLSRVTVAVNRRYAQGDVVLRDGDELALIPPVSGG